MIAVCVLAWLPANHFNKLVHGGRFIGTTDLQHVHVSADRVPIKAERLWHSRFTHLYALQTAPKGTQTNEAPQPPPAKVVTYTGSDGAEHLYLVQEPRGSAVGANAPVLIYMHGAGGKEEQGMYKLFPGLRQLLDSWGWIYACPRDDDFTGLRDDLRLRYGSCTFYLSGASAGGRAVLWEALAHPTYYSGLILMCPAVVRESLPKAVATEASSLPMPVWMICGERDTYYAATCRFVQQALERRAQSVFYLQIPGGNHDDPCLQIRWEDALRFVAGKLGEQGGGRGENSKVGAQPDRVSEDAAR